MQEQLQPFLFQKARRTLPITVKSDTGLCEGEIWFLEQGEITFWCVEVLRVGGRYEMRADVKTLGRNVDLMVEVEDAMAGRDAAMPGGFLHRGSFRVSTEADGQRMQKRFWQMNPEHAPPEYQETAAPTFPRSSMPPTPAAASPGAPPRARSAAAEKPVGGKSARRSHQPARGLIAPRVAEPAPIPPPPLARALRPAPDFAPGAPPTIMVRYQHREIMQADALLQGEEFWVYTGRHPLLWEGQEVRLLLQIPAGSVLELRCTVMADRPDACVLRARHLHASILANLRAALGC